jgi:hypothetical protein
VNPLINEIWDQVTGGWRFRWLALAVAAALALVGWLVVFGLQDRYEAGTSVFVDTRTSLRPALQGLTVEQDVDAELNFVRQSLLASPSLLRVAREGGVLPASIGSARSCLQTCAIASTSVCTVRTVTRRIATPPAAFTTLLIRTTTVHGAYVSWEYCWMRS